MNRRSLLRLAACAPAAAVAVALPTPAFPRTVLGYRIHVEQGRLGLLFITSPDMGGMLAVATDPDEVEPHARAAILHMRSAMARYEDGLREAIAKKMRAALRNFNARLKEASQRADRAVRAIEHRPA